MPPTHSPRHASAALVMLAARVLLCRLPRVLRLASRMMLAARVLLCRRTAPLDACSPPSTPTGASLLACAPAGRRSNPGVKKQEGPC